MRSPFIVWNNPGETVARMNPPEFFEPSHDDAIALLQRHHFGRLAFSFHDRVDIEPISYVFSDGWVYGRTSRGTKLTTVRHHPWVAFEVDEIEGQFDWRSVVVHGTLYFLDDEGADRGREAYVHAVELLRSIDADALTPADATPQRVALFRIYADDITVRAARTSG
jgi:nitroimidazol reductase NimA-like FMN-containing flavoprotein (pyridoxamine 5'-phosphate oxidase superfamily)